MKFNWLKPFPGAYLTLKPHWGVEMPPMMDTGVGRRGPPYYLNDGFGKSKIPNVEFYYYAN